MRELRTLRRARPGPRIRSVQGRLSIELGDEEEAGVEKIKIDSPARSSGFRRPTRSSGKNSGQERSEAPKSSVPVFHPLAYRSVVADWPIEWRERWGRRANALEETGLSWRDAETQAFVEVWHQLRRTRETDLMPAPSATTAIAD